MSAVVTIARKELRALFQSPIAIIFLAIFLVLTLFLFFTQARFFARNLADVRPLFEWLPMLLIFLVAAITMRSWAEERKAGTLEILLTLPVRTLDLVLGKFVAGMGLVILALLLTAPLPITVALLGPLDWGPVLGGYFAAALLASAYMAIGLCVSARTDNQVVALMVTLVIGGLMYLVGSPSVSTFFDVGQAEVLRALGTGSRFQSIERGVLDIRDLLYYGSLTTFFLVLNGVFLDWERLDPKSTHGRTRSSTLALLVVLVGANAFAANLWVAPVNRVRVDLTEGKDYTISPVTESVLGQLGEPLVIRGLFSESTHPLLAPLVPQIRDLLAEYEVYGEGKVRVVIADPNKDAEVEADINENFGVRPVPFGVSDRHSQSVVNAYFHVIVALGDKFEVLDFQDLVEVRMEPAGVQIKLKNLEYDLTRTIKKVTQDFQTIDALIAKLPAQAEITAFITPGAVPEQFAEVAELIRQVGARSAEVDPAKVVFREVDPMGNQDLMFQLDNEYGIRPLSADLFATQQFYLHVLVKVGDHVERIMPRGDMKQPDLESAIEAALRRATPGQLKRVALITEEPISIPNPELPPAYQPPPAEPDYNYLERVLRENYEVSRLTAVEGFVPDEIDTVLVGKLGRLTPRQQYALDQFLMRGGSIIALAGAYGVKADRQGINATSEDAGMLRLLETWGVKIEPELVMDEQNAPFPLPGTRTLPGGFQVQEIRLIPYPFFPDLRGGQLNNEHPALAGISTLTMPWSSPLTVADPLEGREVTWLVRSSVTSTTRQGGQIEPDSVKDNTPEWSASGDPKERTLAVAVTGRFPSLFATLPNPTLAGDNPGSDDSGRTLKASVADGRLVVVGSSEIASDILMAIASNTQTESHMGNFQLVQNLIDWTVEDTELLSIRTAGAFARTLVPLDEAESLAVEIRAWLMVLLPLLLVIAIPRIRRRNAIAIPSVPVTEQA